jgi:hypothetical protein
MKFAIAFSALVFTSSAFAQFTQNPVKPQPSQLPSSVYSCDDDTIILTVHGPAMRGQYELELKNATIAKDQGLNGKSQAGDCVKVEKREMTVIAVPVCTVSLPSGNQYKLAFTGFEGQINTVQLVGQPNAKASCHKL